MLGIVIDKLLKLTGHVCNFLIAFAFVIITLEVLMRYFLHKPILWAIEFSEYVLVTVTFLGCAWVLSKEMHTSMDTVLNHFQSKNRAMINMVTSLLGATLCLAFSLFGTITTIIHFQSGTTLSEKPTGLPLAPFLAVIPVGFFLFFIQFIRRTHLNWLRWSGSVGDAKKQIDEVTEY